LAKREGKGTPLKLFSGKEAKLNRIIFLTLLCKGLLTSYEMWKDIHCMKGYRRYGRASIDRRMKVLHKQNWLLVNGTKPAKAHFLQPLYQISERAETALDLSKSDLNFILEKGSKEQVKKLKEALRMGR